MKREFLPMRNVLADCVDVPSDEMIAFGGSDAPLLSITIPTYRRHEFLVEAIKSALAQDLDHPFEIVVVDDDPASDGHERVMAAMPELASANFRYLRNRRNIGMFRNINRCVESARSLWLTILHDDDLIDPGFSSYMIATLSERQDIDGLICRKGLLDHRDVPFNEGVLKRGARRLLHTYQFGLRSVRPVTARTLFWGCHVGNTVGFICRTEDARAIGGFYPEDHPSCDYFFYARFAEQFRFWESERVLATIRIADNSLLDRANQLACLRQGYNLQLAYAGTVLPRFWRWIIPLLMARQVANTSRVWRSGLTRTETEAALGIRLPADRPLLLFAARTLLGGW